MHRQTHLHTSLPILIAAAIIPVMASCAPGSRNEACRALGTTSGPTPTPNPAFTGSIFTIVMENHTQGQILAADGPDFINSLAAQYSVAAGYRDPYVHPSEPNYLWMLAGENFGVVSDGDPAANHVANTAHLVDQIEMAGLTWRSYQESMGAPCNLKDTYPYATKHNPFVFFDDINGWSGKGFTPTARCLQNVVDYSQLDVDLAAGRLPKYVFITPNMLNDMHDGSVAQGDAWLKKEVSKILQSKAFQDGGVLFLTWDEGSSLGADDPPMIVVSPLAKKGFVSKAPYTTSSYLKTVQTLLGVEPLPCDTNYASVPTMDDLFTVPLTLSAK